VGVGIDIDQNPDTGTYYYGADVAVTFEGITMAFYRANSAGEFDDAAAPASLRGTFGGNVATFTIQAADLGLAPTGGFNFFAIGYASGWVDTAPDIGTFNYELVAGTPAVVPGPDTRAPYVRAFASKGVHGRRSELAYVSADGRGRTAETIKIYRGSTLIKTLHTELSDTNPIIVYDYAWRVPRTLKGKLKFCVNSTDGAGNKSNISCARFAVR
jgi:hypothetical protein